MITNIQASNYLQGHNQRKILYHVFLFIFFKHIDCLSLFETLTHHQVHHQVVLWTINNKCVQVPSINHVCGYQVFTMFQDHLQESMITNDHIMGHFSKPHVPIPKSHYSFHILHVIQLACPCSLSSISMSSTFFLFFH